ncbi:spherulation-specific family 4 protein [Comamonas sp. NLF-1-9]|uniref:spherulation-specific family 4 protein n=1 Tax=Comamonas sp. NLF-1-9 TaxID=2853163 RepID=UPI001C48D2B4|nr:spherulation-specific family 4 protein [Comamonas sp. NLF-1-9]QXL83250.1 hypothetical protein KUD94_08180 [Comamonas sp. NLF-1-9]
MAPPAPQHVYTAGEAIALQVRVLADGAPAPDGLTVRWSTDAGSIQTQRAGTQGGLVSAVLTGAPAGQVTVQASADLQGQSASAKQFLQLRPPPRPLEILVPAYFGAGPKSSGWEALARSAREYPDLRITAILNPSDGIFNRVDAPLLQAATAFRAAGGHVLGYVMTDYGARSLSSVRQNVDRYLELYGSELIEGIFIDEMATSDKRADYYAQVQAYVKSRSAELRVVGNPGTRPGQAYALLTDTLVTFEGPEIQYRDFALQPSDAWLYRRSNAAQAMLVHDAVGCQAMQTSLQRALAADVNTGVVYVTDLHYDVPTHDGDPWAALPSYWDQFVASVAALNRGAALPACR